MSSRLLFAFSKFIHSTVREIAALKVEDVFLSSIPCHRVTYHPWLMQKKLHGFAINLAFKTNKFICINFRAVSHGNLLAYGLGWYRLSSRGFILLTKIAMIDIGECGVPLKANKAFMIFPLKIDWLMNFIRDAFRSSESNLHAKFSLKQIHFNLAALHRGNLFYGSFQFCRRGIPFMVDDNWTLFITGLLLYVGKCLSRLLWSTSKNLHKKTWRN